MKLRDFLTEATNPPTEGIVKFRDEMKKVPGVSNVIIDDWKDWPQSTSYSVFIELKTTGMSKAGIRKSGPLISDEVKMRAIVNKVKNVCKALGLFLRSVSAPTKDYEVSTFMGKKERQFVGYTSASIEVDVVENKPAGPPQKQGKFF